MARAAALFSLATGLSRIVGLLREILVAYVFGVRGAINQFTVASQIPNVVRSLVADAALGAAFIPVFNELLERGEERRAWRVASTVATLSFLGLSRRSRSSRWCTRSRCWASSTRARCRT